MEKSVNRKKDYSNYGLEKSEVTKLNEWLASNDYKLTQLTRKLIRMLLAGEIKMSK